MTDFAITDLLEADFSKLGPLILDVVRNPTSNLIAFVLVLAVFTILMLIVIVVLLLVFTGHEDEEEEYEESDDDRDEGETRQRAHAVSALQTGEVFEEPAAEPAVAAPPRVLSPDELRRQRLRRLAGTLVWVLVGMVVWMAGGWVSAGNDLCTSCHMDDTPHAARLAGDEDPHAGVACVSCHESASTVAVITTAVPARAEHYIASFFGQPSAGGYGRPVKSGNCRACHDEALEVTLQDDKRGLRMSHAEPLDAGAACGDCHAVRAGTGTIDRFTVGMEPCMRCHDAKRVSAECSYCHTKDIAYAMASRGVPTPTSHVGDIDCGSCHSQQKCDGCHGTRMPHTRDFMGVGHAREAVLDIWYNGGRMCKRCHTSEHRPCSRCHQGPFPSHASPTFAKDHQYSKSPGTGCDNCHGYLQWIVGRNFCGNCHPEYPSLIVRP